MLKKTITYNTFDGKEVTEDFYFHLSKAELTEMELSEDGGLKEKIDAVVKAKNGKEIISIFKDLILKSYGEKSEDGKRFVKTQELRDNFSFTEAYSTLFMELASDENAASAFVNGLIVLPNTK